MGAATMEATGESGKKKKRPTKPRPAWARPPMLDTVVGIDCSLRTRKNALGLKRGSVQMVSCQQSPATRTHGSSQRSRAPVACARIEPRRIQVTWSVLRLQHRIDANFDPTFAVGPN